MRLVIRPPAQEDFRRLTPEMKNRVRQAVRSLAGDPRPSGCKLLTGPYQATWRIRVGDYRTLYEVDDAAGVVRILRVRHRSEAYGS